MIWPKRIDYNGIRMVLTDQSEDSSSVLMSFISTRKVSDRGFRADYSILSGGGSVGWLILKFLPEDARLYGKMISEKEMGEFTSAFFESHEAHKIVSRIADVVGENQLFRNSFFELPFVDVTFSAGGRFRNSTLP